MSQKKPRLHLQNIIQTAAEIADKEGIEAVTMAYLAKRLAIRPPSLYNHIDGITELREKLAVYGLKKLYDKLAVATIGKAKDEAIYAFANAYLSFSRSHPGLYELTLSANLENEEHILAGNKIIDLILKVLNGYHLEKETALHAVRGLRSILHGFSSLEQKGGFKLALDLNHSLHLLIDSFILGINRYATTKIIKRSPLW
ncbi:WHG domain-containing protein [Bacillus aquiflavi]|uniref:TetR/AcrR family transcriptional regulator n=1 Tax=Bacillus aquiflavi TaxID=2672567 RepID=A0A6B3VXA3_9BACI|nr:TetR/AcrR family transcriptional regulator [Bacillus aquiflavi]MBA4535990.1 WHG domain-containing protein [Bacillus aquiflavi]NEY80363.1 TetR/AcrR family transcriptional regulator [Bacillus aquiflavi]UAC47720.1 WHG domain-containing protein [Bacillus aquiflavi]